MSDHPVVLVFGEPIEILAPSASTNYKLCVGMQTSPPGGGPPPHRHDREEETFMVLEGEYEFFDGSSWALFRKGEIRVSNRGNFHAFRNRGTTTGKMLFWTNAGGLDEYFKEISPLKLPQDLNRLNEISRYYGYHFMSPET